MSQAVFAQGACELAHVAHLVNAQGTCELAHVIGIQTAVLVGDGEVECFHWVPSKGVAPRLQAWMVAEEVQALPDHCAARSAPADGLTGSI